MLYQPEEGSHYLHLRAWAGLSQAEQHQLQRLRYGRAICARPAEAFQPILATHIQTREAPNRRFVRKLGFRSYLYYPLILNHRLQGTLAFASRHLDDYDPTDLEFFHTLAGTLAEALERQRLESTLQRHAAHLDHLVRERTAKLEETIAELEGFSYSLVHDLRAPLRALHSYASILQDEASARLQPDHVTLLGHIQSAALRMDQLVTDALNYSKILRQDLPLGPVKLGPLLRDMVETYPPLHPPQADVAIDIGDLFVHANQAALTQVFSNLLDNAVKFVAPGVYPRVRVWAEPLNPTSSPPCQVRIWVEDNGIGIPQEAHETIFGMFHRLHRAEEYPGTGIGLALVRKLVGRMGARVGVKSEPGRGSRFWVELKLATGPRTDSDAPGQTPRLPPWERQA
ncbi:MAG TPA: ATP-binding protein, partial [Candidatus Sulfotelmatobacter sp.]|nr:ATP-binding protein [Candidatus Sulfotelmatobacter sp.]